MTNQSTQTPSLTDAMLPRLAGMFGPDAAAAFGNIHAESALGLCNALGLPTSRKALASTLRQIPDLHVYSDRTRAALLAPNSKARRALSGLPDGKRPRHDAVEIFVHLPPDMQFSNVMRFLHEGSKFRRTVFYLADSLDILPDIAPLSRKKSWETFVTGWCKAVADASGDIRLPNWGFAHPDLIPLETMRDMLDEGHRMENCLAWDFGLVAKALTGDALFCHLEGRRPATVELKRLKSGRLIVNNMEGVENDDLPPRIRRQIKSIVSVENSRCA